MAYARIARFEGVEPSAIDEQLAETRGQIELALGEDPPDDAPEAARTLRETSTAPSMYADVRRGALWSRTGD
jgi:hypothetical protein